jgi:hypothetical protein
MGYSDDISAIVEGDLPAMLLLKNVKKRLAEVGISMNVDKSAIMQIVPSQRNKQIKADKLLNIPKVSSYKYLGLEID